jgi:hypothetical protein
MTATCEITNERVKMPCSKSDCLRFGKCVVSYVMGKPKTNADHIRSMTDDELSWSMMQLNFCPPNIDEYKVCGKDANCHQCWLDWLKQPYGGDA